MDRRANGGTAGGILPAGVDRRQVLRNVALLSAGGVGLSFLAGCGRESGGEQTAGSTTPLTPAEQALAGAAKSEGKLVLYTGSEESIVVSLGKAFQQRYGVALEYQRMNSGEIAARYTAEAQAGRTVADLIMTGDYELFQMFGEKGWLSNVDSGAVPGLEAWPAEFKDARTAIVSIVPYTIAINTDQISADPKDWQFLIGPQAKGGLVTLDAKRVNLVAIAAWDLMLKQYGDDFLRKVAQQQPRLVDSAPSAVQQLASGGAKAYFPCSRTQAQSMISQGAPIRAVLPANVPYTGVMTQVGMSANAAHPNAARLFIGFLLSAEGQKLLNVVASSPVGSPGAPPLAPGFVRPDFASTAANKAKIIQLLGM